MNDFLQDTLDQVNQSKNFEYMPNDGASDDIFGGGNSNFFDNPQTSATPIQNNQQSQEQKPQDWYDWVIWIGKKLWNGFVSLITGLISTCTEIISLIGLLNADQFITLFKKMFLVFGPLCLVGLITMLVGIFSETTLAFLGYTILIGTILDLVITGTGFSIINLTAYKSDNIEKMDEIIDNMAEKDEEAVEELNTIQELTSEYNQAFDDILKEVLAEDNDSEVGDDMFGDTNNASLDDDLFNSNGNNDETFTAQPVADINVDTIDGTLVNSKWLFEKLSPVFPTSNPNYNKETTYDEGSDKWNAVFAVICNVFKDLYGCKDIDEVVQEVGMQLETVYDSSMSSHFSIIKPPKGKPQAPEKVKETFDFYNNMLLEALCDKKDLYTGNKSRGNILGINVKLRGNKYEVIISKPNKNPIYVGDVLQTEEMQEAFKNSKNMPFIIGVDDLGNPIYTELCEKASEQYFSLIGGGPGTGKSFAMDGEIAQLLAFNSPKDIQFIFVDPKGVDYGKFEVFPHVLRILNGSTSKAGGEIYDLLKFINEVEYERRSKLFKAAGVQNIQSYKKKGNEMPYLYILLEEFMSIRGTMWPAYMDEYNNEKKAEAKENKEKFTPKDIVKEMDALLVAGVTRWRTAGIFLTIVSHRFTGFVTPAARNNASLRMVLKNETTKQEVFDEKEIKENPKKLMNTGEFALKIGEMPLYTGKTVGVSIDDNQEDEILHKIASSYYKMQVDMPTEFINAMNSVASRKDYNKIREILNLESDVSLDKYDIIKKANKPIIEEDNQEIDEIENDNTKDIIDNTNDEIMDEYTIDEDGTIHTKEEDNVPDIELDLEGDNEYGTEEDKQDEATIDLNNNIDDEEFDL